MLNFDLLNTVLKSIMFRVIKHSTIFLNAIIISVILVNVVAPSCRCSRLPRVQLNSFLVFTGFKKGFNLLNILESTQVEQLTVPHSKY